MSKGVCQDWRRHFGHSNRLIKGDILSLKLTENRSLTIKLNGKAVENVFIDLPHTPLWVVMWPKLKIIEVVQEGM